MFYNRGKRDKDNVTGLKEGGGIEMSTTVLPLRDARSLRFCIYLPYGGPTTEPTSKIYKSSNHLFAHPPNKKILEPFES